MNAAIEPYR